MNSPQETTTLARANAWFATNVQRCPRSPEWKHGAWAGCLQAHGLKFQSSPWPSGSAQDDARNAGFDYGYLQAKHDLAAGAAA